MPTQTPIAEVVAVIGDVQVQRAGGGEPVALNPGDVLYPGDKVLAEPGQTVELSMSDGQTLVLDSGTPVTIAADMLQDTAPGRDEAAVEGESIDELIAALESGEGVDDLLEETAAGAAGDEGNSFVILNRIAEGIPREARADEAAAVEETDVVEDEDPVIPESEPEPENNPPETDDTEGEGAEDSEGIDVALSGSDVDGTVESFTIKSLPANGKLFLGDTELSEGDSVPATGNAATVTFVPDANWNGETTFDYASVDDDTLEDATPATATITVSDVNDPPETANSPDNSGAEDSEGIDVALSGSDVDGTVESFTIKSLPENGKLFLGDDELEIGDSVPATGNAATVTFVPDENWNGVTTFDYASVDDDALEDASPATATITVSAVDDPSTFGSVTPADVDEANLPLGTDPDDPALTDSTGNFVVINDVDGVTSIQIKGVDDWVEVAGATVQSPVPVNTVHGVINVTGIEQVDDTNVYHLNYEFTLDTTVDNDTVLGATDENAVDTVMIRSGDSGDGQSIDVVTITDDEPVPFTADKADEVDASGDSTPALNLNFVTGADVEGSSVLFDATIDGQEVKDINGTTLTVSGTPLTYVLSDDETTLLAQTESGSMTAFSLVLNGDGTYNFTAIDGVISNGTATEASNLKSVGGGNVAERGLFLDDQITINDVLITTTAGTVNTSKDYIGNGDAQSISVDEDIRMTFVTELAGGKDGGTVTDFSWTDYVDVFDFKQEVFMPSGDNAVFTLRAYLDDGDDATTNDQIVLNEGNIRIFNDLGQNVTSSDLINENLDGSITLSGIGSLWTYVIDTEVDDKQFNSVEVTGGNDDGVTVTDANLVTYDGDNFKLGGFTFGKESDGEPITINLELEGTDADGDIASGVLTATIHPKQEGYDVVLDGTRQTDDVLNGGDGAEYILGYGGADTLSGAGGDDILNGGEGSDNLTGGLGADVFKWNFGDGDVDTPPTDTITDFGDGADVLDLSDLLDNEESGVLTSYLSFALDVDTSQGGTTDTVISVSSAGNGTVDQTIVLEGVDLVGGMSQVDIIDSLVQAGKLITD